MRIRIDRLVRLGITSAFTVTGLLLGLRYCDSANAQSRIEPDETLGSERSQVRGLNSTIDLIEGGATPGRNLFHSFQEFNIDAGREAYFIHQLGIDNIFSRVTGETRSEIDGVLGTRAFENGAFVGSTANLFFINPNGILFGPNSSLDVGGSFAATTADGIQFGENGFFSATNPEAPSQLLTIDPSAFFFNQLPVGSITVQSTTPVISGINGLFVPLGENLTLLGGDVNIEGGGLNALGGRIDIGAVSGAGTIGFNSNGSFNVPTSIQRGDVVFTDAARADVGTLESGGDIAVTARSITVADESVLFAGIFRGQGFQGSQVGDIRLDATERILIAQSNVFNAVLTDATGNAGNIEIATPILEALDGALLATITLGQGNAGDITINAGSVFLTNGAQLVANTLGQGNAGNVMINATDRVTFRERSTDGRFPSAAFSRVSETGNGEGGNIEITTPILEVLDGAGLVASTLGRGRAGNVIINATDRVLLDGTSSVGRVSSAIFSTVGEGAVGQGGNIQVTAGILEVLNRSQLTTSTFGNGNAGDISITARERITLANGGTLNAETFTQSSAGDIFVNTDILTARAGSYLTSSTYRGGSGNAGNVIINAHTVNFDGTNQNDFILREFNTGYTGAYSTSEGGTGSAGTVEINTERLLVQNAAEVATRMFGGGNAGNILIRASDWVRFDGGFAVSTVGREGVGRGGDIQIFTGSLFLTNNGELNASTRGRGDAGNVVISASDRIVFDGGDVLSLVGETGNGAGGNIEVTTPILEVLDGAQLIASTFGQGRAGNIIINVSDRVLLDGVSSNGFSSALFTSTTTTATGRGGRITITTPDLRLTNRAVINARTENSQRGGSIIIQADRFEAFNGGQVITSTLGQGQAGNITINADQVRLLGSDSTFAQRIADPTLRLRVANEGNGESGLFANTRAGSTGDGGRITVNSTNLTLTDRARISARSEGTGIAGDIEINASGLLEARNGDIETIATNSSGGDINVEADRIQLYGDSDIRTNSSVDGGNITLSASSILAFDDSDIIAAAGNQGGDITLNTAAYFGENYQADTVDQDPESLEGNDRADINASGAQPGNITTPDTSLVQNSLTELPDTAIDTDTLVANSCVVRSENGSNTFTITGTGGLPLRPGD
ncbi:two-partner secretion domain-containing protein [Thermocoleostomius sinensis]|uniref:Filamentous hemagglutinin N-terminal domain-containing protein n=1 Tax=Thermocoleostomius sinensis A174 TaxID=2016057 RepID=A0A9E8ZHT3_9CYAN|nr:filamentous hemagglutinin N-terminal domain-containing protein [Thermocoleostomius sinensis]WAL61470.1 filamentous hemagglutinin N-terminal domain-containing protein [Thermocoleostomius sinensis A174]